MLPVSAGMYALVSGCGKALSLGQGYCTFKPIALPQLAWSDTLEATCLEIRPAGHWTAVNPIHDSILQ